MNRYRFTIYCVAFGGLMGLILCVTAGISLDPIFNARLQSLYPGIGQFPVSGAIVTVSAINTLLIVLFTLVGMLIFNYLSPLPIVTEEIEEPAFEEKEPIELKEEDKPTFPEPIKVTKEEAKEIREKDEALEKEKQGISPNTFVDPPANDQHPGHKIAETRAALFNAEQNKPESEEEKVASEDKEENTAKNENSEKPDGVPMEEKVESPKLTKVLEPPGYRNVKMPT